MSSPIVFKEMLMLILLARPLPVFSPPDIKDFEENDEYSLSGSSLANLKTSHLDHLIHCIAFTSTSYLSGERKEKTKNIFLEMEMKMQFDVLPILLESRAKVVCAANCTAVGAICKETELKLQHNTAGDDNKEEETVSMIKLVLDVQKIDLWSCKVKPELLFYKQVPKTSFRYTSDGNVFLQCWVKVKYLNAPAPAKVGYIFFVGAAFVVVGVLSSFAYAIWNVVKR